MYKLKEEYKNVIVQSKFGKINLSDIKEDKIIFYIKNGFDKFFEKIVDKLKSKSKNKKIKLSSSKNGIKYKKIDE